MLKLLQSETVEAMFVEELGRLLDIELTFSARMICSDCGTTGEQNLPKRKI